LPETDLASFDFKFDNAAIPAGEQTYYWHRAVTIPLQQKAHIVSWDVIIPDNELSFVHHILIFVCPVVLSKDELAFVGNAGSEPQNLSKCNSAKVLVGWAIGGKGGVFFLCFSLNVNMLNKIM